MDEIGIRSFFYRLLTLLYDDKSTFGRSRSGNPSPYRLSVRR